MIFSLNRLCLGVIGSWMGCFLLLVLAVRQMVPGFARSAFHRSNFVTALLARNVESIHGRVIYA